MLVAPLGVLGWLLVAALGFVLGPRPLIGVLLAAGVVLVLQGD